MSSRALSPPEVPEPLGCVTVVYMSDKGKGRPVEYLGTAGVGAWFGVQAHTVAKWIERYADTDPCPVPDVLVGDRTPGWLPGREAEWRAWEARRPTQGHGRGGRRKT